MYENEYAVHHTEQSTHEKRKKELMHVRLNELSGIEEMPQFDYESFETSELI